MFFRLGKSRPRVLMWGKNYLLIFLILSAIFLRLYKIEERFLFSSETNAKLWPIKQIVIDKKPTLVGIEAVSYLHHLFYPPFALYILAPILVLFDLNPLSIEIALVLLSGLTTYLLYQTGKELFGKNVGLLAAFFYAFSFSMQWIDRYIWVVGPLIFFSTAIILFLNKLLSKKNNLRYTLFLGLFLGLAFNFHYQTGIIFIAILILFLFYRKKFMSFKNFLTILGLVFFFFSPLLIFDLRHNFFNLEGVKILLTSKDLPLPLKERISSAFLAISQNFLSIFSKSFYFKMESISVPFGLQILIIIFLLMLPFLKFLKSKEFIKRILFLFLFLLIFLGLLGVVLVVNRFYRVHYYLFYLQPIFILFTAYVFSLWWKNRFFKVISVLFLLAFLVINLKDFLTFEREVNFKNQLQAVSYILENSTEKVEVYFPKFPDDRYLFLFYYLARKKGLDYSKMVFYQPWQPVNRARFLLYHYDKSAPGNYNRFGGIIVEERSFDED